MPLLRPSTKPAIRTSVDAGGDEDSTSTGTGAWSPEDEGTGCIGSKEVVESRSSLEIVPCFRFPPEPVLLPFVVTEVNFAYKGVGPPIEIGPEGVGVGWGCLFDFLRGNQPFLVTERRDGKERTDVKVVKKKKKENTRPLQTVRGGLRTHGGYVILRAGNNIPF